MEKKRIMIVEDDPMARQLFELYVKECDHFELAESIGNADLADIYCEKEDIDLILMDIRTAMQASGLDAAERIRGRHPGIKIFIVTSMPEQAYLKRAREIGVDSFWYKTAMEGTFIDLVDRTLAGEHIFPDAAPERKLGNASSYDFTDREMEVLRELTTGASNAQIAQKLYMSERTVKAHIQHMQEKTGFANRVELAVKARESGIAIGE